MLSLAVATAGRAAASKSPIPAMEGLLIEAGHNVRVTGYDLKKGIYTTFEADVSAPGSVVPRTVMNPSSLVLPISLARSSGISCFSR